MSNGNNNGHHHNGTGNGLVHANSLPRTGYGGNGHKPDAAIVTEPELLWDGLSPVVTKALGQPLDPALVSQRRGRAGRTYDYLEGHVVIEQANNIFARGGWGYDIVGDVTLREIETVDPKTGEVRRGQAYAAKVMVNVPGAPSRTDVGFHAVAEENVEGHETAYKGSVTDALKRALRSFGDQFGNGLYGDQSLAGNTPRPERVPAQANGNSGQSHAGRPIRQAQSLPSTGSRGGHSESQVQTLRKQLIEIAVEQGFDEDGVRTAVVDRMGKSIDDLTVAELGPLVEAAANKLNQMRQGQAA